jgi:tRNA pseudouridine13 synthase
MSLPSPINPAEPNLTQSTELPEWPCVYGGPAGRGKIRTVPEDFIVDEHLAFEPAGAGEHVFLHIEKKDENTDYVARQLARFADVRQRDVSYAGLKDRHAVTTQWFSVWLPGREDPDWKQFESDNVKVLTALRHARKLKRGVLSGNSFKLVVRDWQGDQEQAIARLEAMKAGGIANYFGPQRFGHEGRNVSKALALFQGMKVKREQRGIYLSAARSYLFNQILASRVAQQTWNRAVAGDIFMFDQSRSFFKSDQPEQDIIRRLQSQDIHPTGALWGKGEPGVSADALAIEQAVMEQYEPLARGLIDAGIEMDRRALRVNVRNLQWQFISDQVLVLSFTLPAGSYATAVLREIIEV